MGQAPRWIVIVAVLLLLLFPGVWPVQAQSAPPSFADLVQTNVSLYIAGFAFASGLTPNAQGQPDGNGTRLVERSWCGSGFLVGNDGTLATNYHVVRRALRGKPFFKTERVMRLPISRPLIPSMT